MAIRYRKSGIGHFELIGEVERIGISSIGEYYVDVVTSSKYERRMVTKITMSINLSKLFIPYLYKAIKAEFNNECLSITKIS
jgi:hypothetical protein